MVTSEFNLASGKENRYHLGGIDLGAIQKHIQGSIRDMKQLLHDPEANAAREDDFAFAEEDRICRYCNFRKVCPKWQ